MESSAARLLQLVGYPGLIPTLVTSGTETAESLLLAAQQPGLLTNVCRLSLLDGISFESKIKSFDLNRLENDQPSLTTLAPLVSGDALSAGQQIAPLNAIVGPQTSEVRSVVDPFPPPMNV